MNFDAIKNIGKAVVAVVSKLPVSFIIKTGVLAGVTIFTAWVMIKRARKMHKNTDMNENFECYSPVDELLGKKNYSGNPLMYDELDDLTKSFASRCDIFEGTRAPKKKGKKKKKFTESQKRRAREIEKEMSKSRGEFRSFIKGHTRTWLDEVDQAARELGLPVDLYSVDDDITPEIRREFSMLF